MLKRTKPLARRTTLCPSSRKRRQGRALIQAACPLEGYCYACGSSQQLTRSHILTVKQHPKQAANPLNVLTLCWPCHQVWEHQKARFAQAFPAAWGETLRRMQLVDAQAFSLFRLKNSY